MEVEQVATLEPLDHAAKLFSGYFLQRVHEDVRGGIGLVGVPVDERSPCRVDYEFICREIELDGAGATKWPGVVDPARLEVYVDGEEAWLGAAVNSSPLDRPLRLQERLDGDTEVEISGVAGVGEPA